MIGASGPQTKLKITLQLQVRINQTFMTEIRVFVWMILLKNIKNWIEWMPVLVFMAAIRNGVLST